MKKIGIIIALFILTFSFSVNAEVFMEFDCKSKEVSNEVGVTCDVVLGYEIININDIEFEYQTNLDIDFVAISGFSLTKSSNKISIHTDKALYAEIIDATPIAKVTLKANSNSNEKETVTLKNIKINKSNETEVYDASETFNVKKTVELDSVCTLDSITIEGSLVPGFDKNKFEYRELIVDKEVVFIDAVRTSNKSSAAGLGQTVVRPGETIEQKITVTAEDNSQKVYKLYITNKNQPEEVPKENLSSDNKLKSLALSSSKEKINLKFDSNTEKYSIKIENSEVETITIKAELNDPKASFVEQYGARDVKLKYGDNTVLVKVKAENGDIKTYTLNINRADNRDKTVTLKSLKINDEIVNLTDDLYKYEITVSKDTAKTKIEAVASSEKAKVTYQDIDLVTGNNSIKITVTAENNDKKEYTINVIRSDKDKVDNVLQSIQIDGYNLGFMQNKKEYSLRISNETKSLKIIVNPSNISYEVLGNEDLENKSKVTVKVTDDNGDNEYIINIIKENNKTNPIIYIICIIMAIAILVAIIYLIRKKKEEIEII